MIHSPMAAMIWIMPPKKIITVLGVVSYEVRRANRMVSYIRAPPRPPAPRQPMFETAYGVADMTKPMSAAGVGLPNCEWER